MLILFTRGTALGGIGNDAAAGDVLDLPDAQARGLIASGRARPAPPVAASAPAEPPHPPKTTRKAK